MIREEEIAELKKHLDANGKLVITDDMSDAQKERYQFINSLDVDLVEVLSRETSGPVEDFDEEDEPDSEALAEEVDAYGDGDDAELLDDDETDGDIEENDSDFQDGLDNFF